MNQWKAYYDKLCVENPSETDLSKIKIEGDKLLEVIAKSLGYKISLETIQKPYLPKGLADHVNQEQQYMNNQLAVMKMMHAYINQVSANETKRCKKL